MDKDNSSILDGKALNNDGVILNERQQENLVSIHEICMGVMKKEGIIEGEALEDIITIAKKRKIGIEKKANGNKIDNLRLYLSEYFLLCSAIGSNIGMELGKKLIIGNDNLRDNHVLSNKPSSEDRFKPEIVLAMMVINDDEFMKRFNYFYHLLQGNIINCPVDLDKSDVTYRFNEIMQDNLNPDNYSNNLNKNHFNMFLTLKNTMIKLKNEKYRKKVYDKANKIIKEPNPSKKDTQKRIMRKYYNDISARFNQEAYEKDITDYNTTYHRRQR